MEKKADHAEPSARARKLVRGKLQQGQLSYDLHGLRALLEQ